MTPQDFLYSLMIILWLNGCGNTLAGQRVEVYTGDVTTDQRIQEAASVRREDPEASLKLLRTLYEEGAAEQDTPLLVYTLIEQARTYGHQARYKQSYDLLWRALSLTETANLARARADVCVEIGRYYSFYKRKEKALEYFNRALTINRHRVAAGKAAAAVLSESYYAFAATYRELAEPEAARRYLDSALLYYQAGETEIDRTYLDFERAFALSKQGQYDDAAELLRSVLPWLAENDPGYQTLVHTYLGDVLAAQKRYGESERAYLDALRVSEETRSHLDFSPLIHQKLSENYRQQGKYEKAYQSLLTFHQLDERFFDSRSPSNRPLLEIQDAYRQEIEVRQREERLAELEREKELFNTKMTALGVTLLLLVLTGFLYFKYVRTRHQAEKRLIRKERELEVQQANEIVSLKNKELAASTLKLIAKDEFIESIRERVERQRAREDSRELASITRAIKSNTGNDQNWQEFEARFVAVNKDFYDTLKRRFPTLTQGDLKLCALIKLNFSSKDVAKLMGISVQSVHTTRYRLRKKLGLVNKENLSEFIAGI